MGYPVCIVEIYGRAGSWEFTLEGGGHGAAPSGDLISVRTDKRLGVETPAGIFDLRLTAARDASGNTWQDRLYPQDVVVIQMMNYQGRTGPNGEGEMHTPMIGFIDTITAMTDINAQGLPHRQIQVRGRDAGKMFIKGLVTYFNFAGASIISGLANFVGDVGKVFNRKPDQVVEKLLTDIYKNFLQIKVKGKGGDINFWDLLGYNLSTFSGEIPAGLDAQFLAGEGTFWSFFAKLASPPFHELFVDTRRVQDAFEGTGTTAQTASVTLGADASCPVLMMRPTPFPYLKPDSTPMREAWNALVLHTVGQDDLVGEPFSDVLSKSNLEQYNCYLTFSQYNILSRTMQLLNIPPILDIPKFHRYGYNPLMPSTLLAPSKESAEWTAFITDLNWRLASWHCLNDQFYSGTKAFKLLPHVHIGERLLDQSGVNPDRQFYIESVSHQFVQNERATTTLGLTRGLSSDDYARYSNLLTDVGLTAPLSTDLASQEFKNLINLGQQLPQ